ncbi:hypothetical protein ZEAMMB73_Zm00001d030279 [Zea mays]|uniref:Uncharacterized protein n=1 Tax=Zea mays TaxID=4577 RepID=A0A1D6KBL6_MAIZE|nr:hypothetical protein ZEAMMB73_Zm00001d030279 [Zea mays]ONM00714.1 hypothetical protein ZEAMMB73_Zm00001d030279 [Zea mays]
MMSMLRVFISIL